MASDDLSFDPHAFSGTVRLFPLPNLVLFPHVAQPLHVFEPRYRAMLEEALETDQLIAMALLAPGWEGDYNGRPPLCPVGCLGRVATHQRLPDGCFNLLLLGQQRVRWLRELPPSKLFREAEVELIDDRYPQAGRKSRPGLQHKLMDAFKHSLVRVPEVEQHLDRLLGGELPLGMLTDIVAHTLRLDVEFKGQLLAEANVDERARMLLQALESASAQHSAVNLPTTLGVKFPPDFSMN